MTLSLLLSRPFGSVRSGSCCGPTGSAALSAPFRRRTNQSDRSDVSARIRWSSWPKADWVPSWPSTWRTTTTHARIWRSTKMRPCPARSCATDGSSPFRSSAGSIIDTIGARRRALKPFAIVLAIAYPELRGRPAGPMLFDRAARVTTQPDRRLTSLSTRKRRSPEARRAHTWSRRRSCWQGQPR
jgi:hypothetical protein